MLEKQKISMDAETDCGINSLAAVSSWLEKSYRLSSAR
jgi:hypothetical protein